jgi:hypothetical protein
VMENVSSLAPQAPFLSMSLPFAGGLSTAEWRARYFQYLYYSGVQPKALDSALRASEMISTMSTFGYERYNPNLTDDFKPITSEEIKNKVDEYAQYVTGFSSQQRRYPRISYLVLRTRERSDLSRFDQYYRRYEGELFGPFILYRVELMNP